MGTTAADQKGPVNILDTETEREEDRQSGPSSATCNDDGEIPLDLVLEILSNERRRAVCRHMQESPGPTSLGSLAEHIAVQETGSPIEELSSSARKRVYIGLYQCHLPKMDDAGVIRFESDRKVIRPGPHSQLVTDCLTAIEAELLGHDTPSTANENPAQTLVSRILGFFR